MNMFGLLNWRKIVGWGTALATTAVFASGMVCQWATPCQSQTAVMPCETTTCPSQCTQTTTHYKTVMAKKLVTTFEPSWTTEIRTRKVLVNKPVQETTMVSQEYTVEVPYNVVSYRTEMVPVTEYVEETAEREEVQTICQPVTKTGMREETFTEEVPVTETVMVNQTRMVPVEETAYETTVEDHGYYKDETELKPRMMLFPSKLEWQSAKDVTDCKTGETVHKPAGLYWTPRDTKERGTYKVKKVWVPNEVEVQKPVVRTVMKQVCEQVPQTVTRTETRTVKKMVPYTYTENIQTQVVRKVPYTVRKPVTRMVEKKVPVTETKYRKEVRTRQVPQKVCRMVQEVKCEQYPVRVCKTTPVTKEVCEAHVIPQTFPVACCPLAPAPTTCCPSTSATILPGTPTPAQAPTSDTTTIPPAQYQKSVPAETPTSVPETTPDTNSKPVATSSKSILTKDEKVEPVTYTQPAPSDKNTTEVKANDISNAKFEQVYSADENKADSAVTTAVPTTQMTPTTPLDSKPREIKAPAVQSESAMTTPAITKVDANAQSGLVRNNEADSTGKAKTANGVNANPELKPIPANEPLY